MRLPGSCIWRTAWSRLNDYGRPPFERYINIADKNYFYGYGFGADDALFG
jgi:hypothetical protein